MKHVMILVCVLFMLLGTVSAKDIAGVTFPDTIKVDDTDLVLNGLGLRKKVIIKVYAAGLYLPKKNKDAASVIKADEAMAFRMHFIYNGVSKEKLIEAWNEGFANALSKNTTPLQNEINTFNSYFTTEAKKNDVYEIVYIPEKGVTVTIKGKAMGTIEGLAFKQALFAIWLGEIPADSGLKEGLLGK